MLYLCTGFQAWRMKVIQFMAPIDYMTGNVSGRQSIEYGSGGKAYAQPSGVKTAANNYEPRLIAKRLRQYTKNARSYYQVRTRTSVNMTDKKRLSMAVLGGAGALFASLVNDKSSLIYSQCVAACPANKTLRQFVFPLLCAALAAKEERIIVADSVYIVNPWISSETPNVPVSQIILDKFFVLGNDVSPYSNEATAALKVAFSAEQWQTIRDYGFAHPEIVGYINDYAPEDAKIAYSLVPTLGVTRWLNATGAQFIDLGITPQGGAVTIEFLGKYVQQKSSYQAFIGNENTTNNPWIGIVANSKTLGITYGNGWTRQFSATIEPGTNIDLHYYNPMSGTATLTLNGVTSTGTTYTFTAINRTLHIFDNHGSASGVYQSLQGSLAYMKYNEVGNGSRDLIPFIHKDNGTDKYGMIDLLTGTFYPDATGNNGFTISEEPNNN